MSSPEAPQPSQTSGSPVLGSEDAVAGSSEPSPPRVPQTKSEGIKLIGGLVVVCAALLVLALIAVVAISVVDDAGQVGAIATAAFSVIGTMVGAYFGVKIGSDGTQAAVAGLKDEAAKAQAFAAHLPPEVADKAIDAAKALAGNRPEPRAAGARSGAGSASRR